MTQNVLQLGNILSHHDSTESQLYIRLGFLLIKILPYTLTAKSQRSRELVMSV